MSPVEPPIERRGPRPRPLANPAAGANDDGAAPGPTPAGSIRRLHRRIVGAVAAAEFPSAPVHHVCGDSGHPRGGGDRSRAAVGKPAGPPARSRRRGGGVHDRVRCHDIGHRQRPGPSRSISNPTVLRCGSHATAVATSKPASTTCANTWISKTRWPCCADRHGHPREFRVTLPPGLTIGQIKQKLLTQLPNFNGRGT